MTSRTMTLISLPSDIGRVEILDVGDRRSLERRLVDEPCMMMVDMAGMDAELTCRAGSGLRHGWVSSVIKRRGFKKRPTFRERIVTAV